MKKLFSLISALAVVAGSAFAGPVDVNKAQNVGQRFVSSNFAQTRQSSELSLVYTASSSRGDASFYVFNVGNEGFVIVSGDDAFRPIIGYSDEGTFDAQNINPNLAYKLNELVAARDNVVASATPQIEQEWKMVEEQGRLMSRNGGRGVDKLVQTKWNQDAPYNFYAPTAPGGPGGRAYAGCCATAMSQVMKFWDHPVQGTGSHSYNWHGQTLSANFGATTYDWANMPEQLSNSSSQEQIEAVAMLMYHCGVAVNMDFAADGSGAFSQDVPGAISNYFGYAGAATVRGRDSYSYEVWADMLKESFDMGWPLYYHGQGPDGGHAFVCDGYNDNDLFHFNFGWSGSGDGWFDFDEIEFSEYADGAIFNYVPASVYNGTAQAPTAFTVTPTSETALSATVSWTNPSKTLNNSNLSSIDKIVVLRNGVVAYTQDNVTPGAAMSFVDEEVPCYSTFNYQVYAITDGNHGKSAYIKEIKFGPTCDWKIMMSSTIFQGWRSGCVTVYDAAGAVTGSYTTNASGTSTADIAAPLGKISFGWTAPTQEVPGMTIVIKDASNNTVYNFSGSSNDLEPGIFLSINNNCGSTAQVGTPTNLYAQADGENIVLTWAGVPEIGYGYNIYRDGLLYAMSQEATYTDVRNTGNGHCYTVSVLGEGGEGESTNEACATATEGCYPPTDLWVEPQSNGKPQLTWVKPEPSEGLSGYYVYRKAEGGDWELAKLASPTATSWKENKTPVEDAWTYYRVQAYYQDIDCTSSPAKSKYSDLEYFVKFYYSLNGVEENEIQSVSIYPNPASGIVTVEAEAMSKVSVFNVMGQKVYEMQVNGNKAIVDVNSLESGIYMVNVIANGNETTTRISVIK